MPFLTIAKVIILHARGKFVEMQIKRKIVFGLLFAHRIGEVFKESNMNPKISTATFTKISTTMFTKIRSNQFPHDRYSQQKAQANTGKTSLFK
jgi:hypothetical protein